jgi:PncC family amidohydrolase
MSDLHSQSLEVLVGELLKERKLTISAAESCTGGLILHRLTNVAGSSAYVMGGVVSYSNQAKMKFLDVQEDTLNKYGAVSEQVAVQMAQGARHAFATDIALSVTGIAGPGGGTEAKPVGLTYIALDMPDHTESRHFVWNGDREQNKAHSAEAALQLLYDVLTQ